MQLHNESILQIILPNWPTTETKYGLELSFTKPGFACLCLPLKILCTRACGFETLGLFFMQLRKENTPTWLVAFQHLIIKTGAIPFSTLKRSNSFSQPAFCSLIILLKNCLPMPLLRSFTIKSIMYGRSSLCCLNCRSKLH